MKVLSFSRPNVIPNLSETSSFLELKFYVMYWFLFLNGVTMNRDWSFQE